MQSHYLSLMMEDDRLEELNSLTLQWWWQMGCDVRYQNCFHPIPLGVWGGGRRKERKEREKEMQLKDTQQLIYKISWPE